MALIFSRPRKVLDICESTRFELSLSPFLTCPIVYSDGFGGENRELTVYAPFNDTNANLFLSFLCSYVLGSCVVDSVIRKLLWATPHLCVCLLIDSIGHYRSHTDGTTRDETSFMEYPNPMQKLIPTSLLTRFFYLIIFLSGVPMIFFSDRLLDSDMLCRNSETAYVQE